MHACIEEDASCVINMLKQTVVGSSVIYYLLYDCTELIGFNLF